MLIVLRDIADEVLERAESIVNTEKNVRDAVESGMHPLAAYR